MPVGRTGRDTTRSIISMPATSCRVVVYGQEGLTIPTRSTRWLDHDATDRLGAGARSYHTAGLASEISVSWQRIHPEPSVAVEIESYRPFFILGEVAAPGQYPSRAEHDGRKRGGDRRRLLAACPATASR